MKLILIALLLSVSSYAQVVTDKIITKNLVCLQQTNDDYLVLRQSVPNTFSLYLKTDLCSLLEAKSTPSQHNFDANLYIELNEGLHSIPVEDYYNALIPIAIHHSEKQDKVFIVEFQMMSHIKTERYVYVILDLRQANKLNYTELDGTLPLKNIQAIFSNYIRSKYKVKSVAW